VDDLLGQDRNVVVSISLADAEQDEKAAPDRGDTLAVHGHGSSGHSLHDGTHLGEARPV
jgi:hypothetical protein